MAATRRTVELGRASRAHGKVKVRQPLAKAVVVATDAERAAIGSQEELVKAELNVKEIEFVTDQSDLVSYSVKPNYKTLGPRFGKGMPQVAAAVGALDADHVADTIESGGEIGLNIDGKDHTLAGEDLLLSMEPVEGYQVESESGHAVALALELDDALLKEGIAREIVHAVQTARKNAGFEITDRISLSLGGDDELIEAAREHQAWLSDEVLATSTGFEATGGEAMTIDGRELRIEVTREN